MKLCNKLILSLFKFAFISSYTTVNAESGEWKPLQRSEHPPNIIWIIAEDASPMHLSIYGERNIKTPNIDRIGSEGVIFKNAFVNAPVCSPSRSSMATGVHVTSSGALHHRSQRTEGLGADNELYHDSYRLPEEIPFIPQSFQEAGYYTVLAGWYGEGRLGKSDYNFAWDESHYDGSDWVNRDPSKPLFAQIQLRGGKNRSAEPENPAGPEQVNMPPYYPTHPVLIQDWARYLNSIMYMDQEVGNILEELEKQGMDENTMVIFSMDHGVAHLRSKQFLYEEGIRTPILIRWPGRIEAGTVRTDLVSVLDLTAAIMVAGGLNIPPAVQGRDFLNENYTQNDRVYATSDRLDETVDMMRSVRSGKYKYIRNFYYFKPHLRKNRYKLSKDITQITIKLHNEGRLNEIQNRLFMAPRPVEELYDLENDPFELYNLAADPANARLLEGYRDDLEQWMIHTKDMGLIPEIELEQLGRKYGSKYAAIRSDELKHQSGNILEMKRIALKNGRPQWALRSYLDHPDFGVRYWAAVLIALDKDLTISSADKLKALLRDESASVRLAAVNALITIGETDIGLEALARELEHENYMVRHYALLVGDDHVDAVKPLREIVRKLRDDTYEYTSRVAWRLSDKIDGETARPYNTLYEYMR